MNTILIDQFTDSVKYKILNIGAIVLAIWICIVVNCFEYQLITSDLVAIASAIVSSLISTSLFGYIYCQIK